jgi:L-ascorbate metabolism protein UlaG (beta-lactamase superfamily)
MQNPKYTLEITYPTITHMHYLHQGNANALDHFIVL